MNFDDLKNLDLKNLNVEDLKQKVLAFADKKTLIKDWYKFGFNYSLFNNLLCNFKSNC